MTLQTQKTIIKTGELYWCEPDPKDTVGSEIEKDRIWVIVSSTHLHRGNCVVGVPLTKNLSKACSHLVQIPKAQLILDGTHAPYDSVAVTDQIRCLDKTRFRRKAGTISKQGLNAILHGMDYLFRITDS